MWTSENIILEVSVLGIIGKFKLDRRRLLTLCSYTTYALLGHMYETLIQTPLVLGNVTLSVAVLNKLIFYAVNIC